MPPNKMLIYKGDKGNFTKRKFIKLISNGTHGNGATQQMHWKSPAPTGGVPAKDAQPESGHEETPEPKPRESSK